MNSAFDAENPETSGRLTKEAFETFVTSPELRALETWKPPFSPLRVLGVERRELSHSAFLRFVLDPLEAHGLGNRFLCRFLENLAPAFARDVGKIRPEDVTVHLEYDRIDIVVVCGAHGPVIGIEVKVWAGEGWEQIKRYQASMAGRFPGRQGIVVFLTPEGRDAETADPDSAIRCVSLSWLDVERMLHEESRHCRDAGVAAFVGQFGRHLRDMINGDSEERKLVSRLFKNPGLGAAALRAAELRPNLFSAEVASKLKDAIESLPTSESVEVSFSIQSRRREREVLFRVNSNGWGQIPLVFLFYDFPFDSSFGAGMHVLLEQRLPAAQSDVYVAALRKAFKDTEIADELIPLKEWGGDWHLALPPSEYPNGSERGWKFEDESFDEEWIETAAQDFKEAYSRLGPVLELYLQKNV